MLGNNNQITKTQPVLFEKTLRKKRSTLSKEG